MEHAPASLRPMHPRAWCAHPACRSDLDELCDELIRTEPLISAARRPQLRSLLLKLVEKQIDTDPRDFHLFKILRAHILPLTNCAFNKGGDKFITGSYDRTCKVSARRGV